MSDCCTTFKCS